MATVECNDEKVEVQDNQQIKNACRELGVPFACENGVCGTCMIKVVEGAENLNELNEKETDMDRDRVHRLACQAKIKHGKVKIEY